MNLRYLQRLRNFIILVTMVSIEGIFSTVCLNNKLCRVETLSSSLKTKTSYFSLKRFSTMLLNKTALEKSVVKSEQHCIKKCMTSTTCVSVNIITNLTSNATYMECQLLTQQAYSSYVDLINQANSTHLSGLNLGCEKNLCTGNATCVPSYVDDAFSCVCPSSIISGTYCEIEKKVSSIYYGRTTETTDNMDIVTRDPNFKKTVQSSSCSLNLNVNNGGENIRSQMFAYFIPPDTGLFYLHLTCTYDCRLYISTFKKQDRKVFLWGAGAKSRNVYLEKDQKIAIEMVAGTPPQTSNTYSLGVTLPNGTKYTNVPDSFFYSLLYF